MTKNRRSFASLLAVLLIVATAGAQASANWSEGFVIEKIQPTILTETEETPADPASVYAAEVLRLVNLEREKEELKPLSGLAALRTAANTRAREVSSIFAHVRPDGTSPRTAFTENGLNYRYVGENIARGYAEPSSLVEAWMNSEMHKNVILREEYTHGELGYFQNEDGKIFCSMLFITPVEG